MRDQIRSTLDTIEKANANAGTVPSYDDWLFYRNVHFAVRHELHATVHVVLVSSHSLYMLVHIRSKYTAGRRSQVSFLNILRLLIILNQS